MWLSSELCFSFYSESMASSRVLLSFQPCSLKKSLFFGDAETRLYDPSSLRNSKFFKVSLKTQAKFNLWEIMGGRGLCSGEEGLLQELAKTPPLVQNQNPVSEDEEEDEQAGKPDSFLSSFNLKEDAFEKELLGFTGGFPGGEKGLNSFVEKNPPPQKKGSDSDGVGKIGFSSSKPKSPTLPLFMPGMIVIVKNPNNPFYMYCGIVQRITDGKAGVLFEGGNWDKLITFELSELERREKGPPMVNPKSAILENLMEK